ncbi:hypothetical protein GHI93_08895 [Lactococcus hircilactis]|uniref:Uncharacterized protein n=1 Tax=Lactococcus hircilactis TaxID=1494462 RepID=A0A7X2D0Z2_9LACT|nr:hypothetical protein [Lactococcus hircilactis]MQW40043.1 hypothetical protein [Lactococcus hircilactis]
MKLWKLALVLSGTIGVISVVVPVELSAKWDNKLGHAQLKIRKNGLLDLVSTDKKCSALTKNKMN